MLQQFRHAPWPITIREILFYSIVLPCLTLHHYPWNLSWTVMKESHIIWNHTVDTPRNKLLHPPTVWCLLNISIAMLPVHPGQ